MTKVTQIGGGEALAIARGQLPRKAFDQGSTKGRALLALLESVDYFASDVPIGRHRCVVNGTHDWLRSRDTEEYQSYAAEFSQLNNHFHLDEKGGATLWPLVL